MSNNELPLSRKRKNVEHALSAYDFLSSSSSESSSDSEYNFDGNAKPKGDISSKNSSSGNTRKLQRSSSASSSSSSEDDNLPVAQLTKKAKLKPSKQLSSYSSSLSISKKTTKESIKKERTRQNEKSKATKSSLPSVRRSVKANTKVNTKANLKAIKEYTKEQEIDMAMKAYRWWHEKPLPEGIEWYKLEHNGMWFPPMYEPHGTPLLYEGEKIILPAEAEEVATYYATVPLDGPQLGNATIAPIFKRNFFGDFRNKLKPHPDLFKQITKLKSCDFQLIREYTMKEKEKRKNRSKEEKQKETLQKAKENEYFGYAIVNDHIEKIGNVRAEPPNLFRGRGVHPKTGMLKEPTAPEGVVINCGIHDVVPMCPIPGHAWKEVIHRDTVTWLATWNDPIMNRLKYMFLNANSSFRGKADLEKYEKARRLKLHIEKIRKDYISGLKSKDKFTLQRSTAMWVIDILALRVGTEKGDDEAHTFGCCSLQCQHVDLNPNNYEITLSFLGKDSMPYENTIDLERYGETGKLIYQNVQRFLKNKHKTEDVFDELTPVLLNTHLKSLMPGLTAKVFRTYNASVTLEQQLPYVLEKDKKREEMNAADKVVKYNEANRAVAILCNHQRTVPKTFDTMIEKLEMQRTLLKEQLNELEGMRRCVKAGKNLKKLGMPKKVEEKKVKHEKEEKEKDNEKNIEEEIMKKKEAHLFSKQPSLQNVEKRIDSWRKKIEINERIIKDKSDNKEVSLTTSKMNYMDPRISVAWCKRNEVPISMVFSKLVREKFVWAMDAEPEWKF